MATLEETKRGGRKICTMRYFGGVAIGMFPRELTWRAEKNVMEDQAPGPRAAMDLNGRAMEDQGPGQRDAHATFFFV